MDITAGTSGEAVSPQTEPTEARLREFNHRVLNSLTMISSIIRLESRSLEDSAGREALERVRSRLVAVSNLYRILSDAEPDSLIRGDLYLRSVVDAVAESVGSGERIAVEVAAVPCELTASQAAALGLIANEAMTNAYKHAFPNPGTGRIVVSLSECAAALTLAVADDGAGVATAARDGLGTTLIDALATDLAGEVSVSSGKDGTCVRVRFPKAG